MEMRYYKVGRKFEALALAGFLCMAGVVAQESARINPQFHLIAHRGGVVDNGKNMENSIAALDEAVRRGYTGVEIDVRQSKDGVLYLYHNRSFEGDYDSKGQGSEMTWKEIAALRPLRQGGAPPALLEDYLHHAQGKVSELMIDIKENKPPVEFYQKLEKALVETNFLKTALFIGHGDYFRGKGCKITMLIREKDEFFKQYGDKTKDYYFLFGGVDEINGQILKWCKDNGIRVVACANLPFRGEPAADNLPNAGRNIEWLAAWGVTDYQIDSAYDIFFREKQDSPKETAAGKYILPYKNTYNKEPLVTENEYRIAKPVRIEPKSFAEAKNILPNPIWENHPKEVEMYWKAWEIAVGNIRQVQEGSGFVSPYLDIAYNGNIFMWDASFMMMFARYGYRFFPFQNSLDNFYAKQHPDGFICREIKADGADCFERYDPVSTGPNIMPWAELSYYKQYGDIDRLHKVFPVLCAYYKWLKLNRTWQNGTYWSSGWGTGMDNMPRVPSGYNLIYSNGHMVWLDANLQQLFMANVLLEIGFYLERWQEIEDFEDEIKSLSKYIRENLWDAKTGFLYDQYADGSLNSTKGIGAYWALYTDVLDKTQLDKMVKELTNKATFDRPHRVPSLSADHPKYNPKGRYWQGGVWPGTNYMVITGLDKKGYTDLAKDIAANHYGSVLEVYKNTGTFWEYYAPEAIEPGFMARKDFVGWTGLPPIAVFIEYILGIRSDYSENKILWDITQKDAHGIERYPFGPDGLVTLKVQKRNSTSDTPVVTVETNIAFELTVKWGKDKTKTISLQAGSQTINL